MEKVVGQPARGESFFGREREIALLWQQLDSENVLLLAPRRVGKTSIMYRLADEAESRGRSAVYLTVEGAEDETEFVTRLHAAAMRAPDVGGVGTRLAELEEGALGKLLRRVRRVDTPVGGVELDAAEDAGWRDVGTKLVEALARPGRQLLLLVDEVPVFVLRLLERDPTGKRAQTFLHWFRELRTARELAGRIRWLLAGSIGLDAVARRLRLTTTINDLYVVNDLGAFDEPSAVRLLDALALTYNVPLDEATKKQMLRRVGWLLPYYVQLMFSGLHDLYRIDKIHPSPRAVLRVYESLLSKRTHFDHWHSRLSEELGSPDDRRALDLLAVISHDPQGATRDTLSLRLGRHIADAEERDRTLRYLLDVLEGDGYLAVVRGRHRFRSPLLREFWIRRIAPPPAEGEGSAR